MSDSGLSATVADALDTATERLADAGRDTPRLDAEVLLRHVLRLDRTGLFLRLREPLSPTDRAAFVSLVAERSAGVPVAYLTGTREFMGLPLAVGSGVLVPRPETELLVEWALAWLEPGKGAAIVDIGTGSGAIALALAAHDSWSPLRRIVAADVSAAALGIAAHNRVRLGLNDRVDLVRGDLLGWCGALVDLLLANLPYLRPDQLVANPDLAVEPALALDGGPDGLDFIRRLLADAPRVLAAGGAVGLEIDPSQATAVHDLAGAIFPAARIDVRPDLAGLARHVFIQT